VVSSPLSRLLSAVAALPSLQHLCLVDIRCANQPHAARAKAGDSTQLQAQVSVAASVVRNAYKSTKRGICVQGVSIGCIVCMAPYQLLW
jgi:hypothetical protein